MKTRRCILITGAGSGIGKGLAEGLAREGHFILVSDQDVGAAKEVADRIIQTGGTA